MSAATGRLAAETFNHVWTLIEKPDRSPRETELMIHAAHASRFLWEEAGTAVNHARGEWLVSRAYAIAQRPGPSLHHARLCLETAEQAGLGPFDAACGHEAVARACVLAGVFDQAEQHVRRARALADQIEDPEDRAVLIADLASLVPQP